MLVGIVIGSLLVARRAAKDRGAGRYATDVWRFGALQILIGLGVLAVMLLPPAAWQRLGTGLGVYFTLLLLPAVLSGASFPIAVRLATEAPSRLGYEVGRVAAINILGGIAGSLLAGFIGLPRLGLHASVIATTGLSLAIGVAAWMLPRSGRRPIRDAAFAAAAVARGCGSAAVGTRVPADFLAIDGPLLAIREGMMSNVAVVRKAHVVQLRIDRCGRAGTQDAPDHGGRIVPMLLHPDPRRAGRGSGHGTDGQPLPRLPARPLDVVDIEPAVFDVIRPTSTRLDGGSRACA